MIKTLTIDTDLIIYAFRYCLGRQTYCVLTMTEQLKKHWKDLVQRIIKMLEHELDSPSTHTETELETAYAAGYNACHDGLTTNPYPVDSILAQQWQAGWNHYDADYNPEYYKPQYFEDL